MYRGFGRNFRRFATEAKSNWSDVKARLVKANRPLLFWMSATATLTAAGVTYQLYDFQPLNKIGSVLSRLRQSEPETVSEGLDSLNDCFYIEKRVFSGSVAIPVSESVIQSHEPELVNSLVSAATKHGDTLSIRWRALSWLLHLSRQSHTVRSQIVNQEKVEDLISLLAAGQKSDGKNEWFIAANILSLLLKDSAAAAKINPKDRAAIEKAQLSLAARKDEPLALIAAAQLGQSIASAAVVGEGFTGALGDRLNSHILTYSAAPTAVNLQPYHGAGMVSILLNSAFAAAYGAFWWRARATTKGLTDAHPNTRPFLKTRYVGRKLFALLALDMLAQRFMKYASTEKLSLELKEEDFQTSLLDTKIVYDLLKEFNDSVAVQAPPALSSVYPVVQTGLFGLGALALLKNTRFVVLPLTIAAAYNHRDLLAKNEYVQAATSAVCAGIPADIKAKINLDRFK